MRRAGRLVVAALGALALGGTFCACKRASSSGRGAAEAGVAPAASPASGNGGEATAAATATAGADPFAISDAHEIVPADFDAPTVTLPAGSDTITVATPGKAPSVDPFDAAILAAKAQAVGCFAPLPAGDYAVSLSVVVSPGGRATRVNADSASVTDASVLACVRGVGESYGWPSSPSGRTLELDVRVSGK